MQAVEWWDARQAPLALAAIATGAVVGLAVPASADALAVAVAPLLILLLTATFLGIPVARLRGAWRDVRFLVAALALNFVLLPAAVLLLTRAVADDEALLIGALLVLLTPCVDYVIVFAGLAGGAADRLLAITPWLMLLQIVLLPAYLLLLAGPATAAVIEPGPFVEAAVLLIAVPLAVAASVQVLAPRLRAARAVRAAGADAMTPLLVAVLIAVVGSQIAAVQRGAEVLLRLVPLYTAFVVLAVLLGVLVVRAARLDVTGARAVVLSGTTRNSLVVLPLALALPAELALAPLAVVTQTLVELVALVVLVRLLPRILPARAGAPAG